MAREAGHVAVGELIESWSYRACPILFMPFDALVHVMAFLDPSDLCAVAQACSVSTPTSNLCSPSSCLAADTFRAKDAERSEQRRPCVAPLLPSSMGQRRQGVDGGQAMEGALHGLAPAPPQAVRHQ